MTKCSRVFPDWCCAGTPRYFSILGWNSLAIRILRDYQIPCPNWNSFYRRKLQLAAAIPSLLLPAPPTTTSDCLLEDCLLNDNFLLLRVHSTLRGLRCHRNDCFPCRQRRREIVERAIRTQHRHFTAVYHDPRPVLRLARHFDHM